MFKVNKPERCNDVYLVSLLLTLNIFYTFSRASVVDFEYEFVCWVEKKPLLNKNQVIQCL